MSNAQKSTNTNANDELVAFFSKNEVVRTRSSKATDGGRYNPNLRTLTLPKQFKGKKAGIAYDGGNLLIVRIMDDGKYAVHPTQGFIKFSKGTLEGFSKPLTFKRVYKISATLTLDADGDTVAYEIPAVDKK